MPKKKLASKPNFSVRVAPGNLKRIDDYIEKMGGVKAEVFRNALDIGMSFIEWPEYYAARLKGITLSQMMSEVRKTIKTLSS